MSPPTLSPIGSYWQNLLGQKFKPESVKYSFTLCVVGVEGGALSHDPRDNSGGVLDREGVSDGGEL